MPSVEGAASDIGPTDSAHLSFQKMVDLRGENAIFTLAVGFTTLRDEKASIVTSACLSLFAELYQRLY